MIITVTNASTVESDDTIRGWIYGFQQFARSVTRYWGRHTQFVFKQPAPEDWQLVFADSSDQAGALGYHNYTPGGKPLARVFLADDRNDGASETVTATHEIAEMIADPWISLAMQTSPTRFYAVELGDPVEADRYGWTVKDGNGADMLVSDFVLPGWFIPGHPGPYDLRHYCAAPLEILAGGYAQYFDGGWQQVGPNGEHVPLDTTDPRARSRPLVTESRQR